MGPHSTKCLVPARLTVNTTQAVPTVKEVSAGVAIEAPGVDFAHILAQPQWPPLSHAAIQAPGAVAGAVGVALCVALQALALRVEALDLEAAWSGHSHQQQVSKH